MTRSALTLLFSILLAGSSWVAGQNEKCDHTTTAKERFEAIRILPPVKIIYFDGRQLEYSHEDSRGIHLGSFKVDPDSSLPSEFGKKYRSEFWWILYCSKDGHLYAVQPVGQIQKKALK